MDKSWTSIGQVWPVGIPVAQSWLDIGAVLRLTQDEQVALVVEIGLHKAGLASLFLLREEVTPGFRYYGIERDARLIPPALPKRCYRVADAWAADTVTWAREQIGAADGPTLILCDGGDKPRELVLYAPLLRPGDLI